MGQHLPALAGGCNKVHGGQLALVVGLRAGAQGPVQAVPAGRDPDLLVAVQPPYRAPAQIERLAKGRALAEDDAPVALVVQPRPAPLGAGAERVAGQGGVHVGPGEVRIDLRAAPGHVEALRVEVAADLGLPELGRRDGGAQDGVGEGHGAQVCQPQLAKDLRQGFIGQGDERGAWFHSCLMVLQETTLAELSVMVGARVKAFCQADARSSVRRATQARALASLAVCRRALAAYTFDELAISFNGGKDCLVLLLLLLAAMSASAAPPARLRAIYVTHANAFPQMDAFVAECCGRYFLDLQEKRMGIRQAFEEYTQANPVKAVFVGTRRTDPHGHALQDFHMTDRGWPAFMRIHPIIDWHYVEVWEFLRALDLPYCALYDQGYTSLGVTDDTLPNPALRRDDNTFRPAYELMEDDKERWGRR